MRALRVVATHGMLPEERDRPQPFELDLDVWVAGTGAGTSDTLGNTVDYGTLVAQAASVVRARSFLLLEAVAEAVAEAVLGLDARVLAVTVTVRKLRPPVPEDVASIGVRVQRGRAGAP